VRASLGGGNPTALAELNSGDADLDPGFGGGIDVLLSARARSFSAARNGFTTALKTLR
jgi:hypothetical protein